MVPQDLEIGHDAEPLCFYVRTRLKYIHDEDEDDARKLGSIIL
mgnify:FL=1